MGNWHDNWVDYYKILEIDRTANKKQIKKKYYELMRQYHPDVYKGKDGDEKSKLINEAYSVLSNPKEKKQYDLEYDKRLSSPSTDDSFDDQSTEEKIKNYSEQEQKYAKKVAFEAIIDDELEKAKVIIDTKNEIIFSAYNQGLDKLDYYKNIKEFANIANEYIMGLYEMCNLCYEYDLLDKIEVINEVIIFLEDNINCIPLSPNDAIEFMENENKKKNLTQLSIDITEQINQCISDIESFFVNLYTKKISHIEYPQFTENLHIKAYDIISNAKQLILLLNSNKIKDEKFEEALGKINAILKTWPKDYQAATEIGKFLTTKIELSNVLDKYESYSKKIEKIIKIIKRYPTNHHLEILHNYSKKISQDMESLINLTLKNQNSDEIANNIIDKAYTLSTEAEEIYLSANKKSKEAEEIYRSSRKTTYNDKEIRTLMEEAVNQFDKGKSLELLNNAHYYIKILEFINIFNIKDNKEILVLLQTAIETIHNNIEIIDNMMEKINEIMSKYNPNLKNINIDELLKRVDELNSLYEDQLINNSFSMGGLIFVVLVLSILSSIVTKNIKCGLIFSSITIIFFIFIKLNKTDELKFYNSNMSTDEVLAEIKSLLANLDEYNFFEQNYQNYLDLKMGKIL